MEEDLLAYVEWYTVIPAAQTRNIQMHVVSKQFWGGDLHASDVVPHVAIVALCPLLPVINGVCPEDVTSDTCYKHFSSFYINSFASTGKFACLK